MTLRECVLTAVARRTPDGTLTDFQVRSDAVMENSIACWDTPRELC